MFDNFVIIYENFHSKIQCDRFSFAIKWNKSNWHLILWLFYFVLKLNGWSEWHTQFEKLYLFSIFAIRKHKLESIWLAMSWTMTVSYLNDNNFYLFIWHFVSLFFFFFFALAVTFPTLWRRHPNEIESEFDFDISFSKTKRKHWIFILSIVQCTYITHRGR